MKKKLLLLITAGFLLALNQLSLAASCGPCNLCPPCCCSNWYVAGSGAVVWHNDSNVRGILNRLPVDLTVDYKVGGGAAASIGYIFDLCNCWDIRLEAEGVWRRNSVKSLSVPGTSLEASGYSEDLAIMGNLLLDAPLGCDFSLYLGGGIGASRNTFGSTSSSVKHHKTLFAWQILAGLSYEISQCLALTGGYRLFATEKRGENGFEKKIPFSNSIDIGLRFRF